VNKNTYFPEILDYYGGITRKSCDPCKKQGPKHTSCTIVWAEINCEQFKVVIKSASPESFILANAVSKKLYPNHTSVLKTKSILCVNPFSRLQIKKWSSEEAVTPLRSIPESCSWHNISRTRSSSTRVTSWERGWSTTSHERPGARNGGMALQACYIRNSGKVTQYDVQSAYQRLIQKSLSQGQGLCPDPNTDREDRTLRIPQLY